ncbi:CS1 type fimbrial major subunit [Pseudomonas fildesensis]|uniref:CS1 type fimbrial major subunit n=1 Tax=Pseudomonas fildesensis TaxID=1674920 RepID=UPI00387B686D
MLNKTTFVIPALLLAMGTSSVFAAGEATTNIKISASIPTKLFHAQPRNPDFGKAEVMSYNPVSGTLSSLRETFDVKNTEGSVHAYIEGGPASLTNGTNSIALTTTFNGKTLTAIPQEVVTDEASTPGTQVDLLISAAKPADTQSGLYNADFTVVFDAVSR